MNASAVMPGDNQTLEAVDAWVRTHVSTGTIMVLRRCGPIGIEFHLVEVDLLSTSTTFLFAPAWGSFATTGKQDHGGIHAPRLLIPLPDVVRAAAEAQVLAKDLPAPLRRKGSGREISLVSTLHAQSLRRGEHAD